MKLEIFTFHATSGLKKAADLLLSGSLTEGTQRRQWIDLMVPELMGERLGSARHFIPDLMEQQTPVQDRHMPNPEVAVGANHTAETSNDHDPDHLDKLTLFTPLSSIACLSGCRQIMLQGVF